MLRKEFIQQAGILTARIFVPDIIKTTGIENSSRTK